MTMDATDLVAQLSKVGLLALAHNLDDFLARATKGRWSPAQIVEEVVAVASGKKTMSELAGELAPWVIGPVM